MAFELKERGGYVVKTFFCGVIVYISRTTTTVGHGPALRFTKKTGPIYYSPICMIWDKIGVN